MKRKPFYLIAILCLGFAVCSFVYADRTACISAGTSKTAGAKDVTVETRQVGKFSALECSGSTPVTYVQSDKSEVVIEGNREFIDAYVSEVKGETLNLHMKPGNYQFLNLRVTVYSPVLDDIEMSGSGTFTDVGGHQSVNDVEFAGSGSGKIVVGKLACKDFEAAISGSGSMTVDSIVCEDAEFASSGSGSITVKSLTAREDVEVSLAGSGKGLFEQVDIAGDLDMAVSGSGSIKVNGKARDVEAVIAGSGDITGNLSFRHIDSDTSGSGKVRFLPAK